MLSRELNLNETLRLAPKVEGKPISRTRLGSPCRFVRRIDILVHLVVPELIEDALPRVARYLRRTSPRWGRSWRSW
jgi:hypothetical protein